MLQLASGNLHNKLWNTNILALKQLGKCETEGCSMQGN